MLPFSLDELKTTRQEPTDWETLVFNGGYPRLYAKGIHATDFYPAYINTYIEKDVRQIKNIENLHSFSQFLKLCAGRIGQVLNLQALASDACISPHTAKAWPAVLEASYIVHLLQPHHKNFNKRLVN